MKKPINDKKNLTTIITEYILEDAKKNGEKYDSEDKDALESLQNRVKKLSAEFWKICYKFGILKSWLTTEDDGENPDKRNKYLFDEEDAHFIRTILEERNEINLKKLKKLKPEDIDLDYINKLRNGFKRILEKRDKRHIDFFYANLYNRINYSNYIKEQCKISLTYLFDALQESDTDDDFYNYHFYDFVFDSFQTLSTYLAQLNSEIIEEYNSKEESAEQDFDDTFIDTPLAVVMRKLYDRDKNLQFNPSYTVDENGNKILPPLAIEINDEELSIIKEYTAKKDIPLKMIGDKLSCDSYYDMEFEYIHDAYNARLDTWNNQISDMELLDNAKYHMLLNLRNHIDELLKPYEEKNTNENRND